MRILLMTITLCLLSACASQHEKKAPCTYDNRSQCGPLVYTGH